MIPPDELAEIQAGYRDHVAGLHDPSVRAEVIEDLVWEAAAAADPENASVYSYVRTLGVAASSHIGLHLWMRRRKCPIPFLVDLADGSRFDIGAPGPPGLLLLLCLARQRKSLSQVRWTRCVASENGVRMIWLSPGGEPEAERVRELAAEAGLAASAYAIPSEASRLQLSELVTVDDDWLQFHKLLCYIDRENVLRWIQSPGPEVRRKRRTDGGK